MLFALRAWKVGLDIGTLALPKEATASLGVAAGLELERARRYGLKG